MEVAKLRNPSNPKERNILKGAMRRCFSRSDLRRKALAKHDIDHSDVNRPRVTKWSYCGECGVIEPRYLMEVDHQSPLVPVHRTLEDLSWDEVVDRLWCDIKNLVPLCKPCHKLKSKAEALERKAFKKGKTK